MTCRHSDYVIDAARKQQGFRLLCCTAPRGVAVVEVQEADDDHLPAAGDLSIKLQKLEPLSDGCTAKNWLEVEAPSGTIVTAVAGDQRYRPSTFQHIPNPPGRLWLHAQAVRLPTGLYFESPLPAALVEHRDLLRTL